MPWQVRRRYPLWYMQLRWSPRDLPRCKNEYSFQSYAIDITNYSDHRRCNCNRCSEYCTTPEWHQESVGILHGEPAWIHGRLTWCSCLYHRDFSCHDTCFLKRYFFSGQEAWFMDLVVSKTFRKMGTKSKWCGRTWFSDRNHLPSLGVRRSPDSLVGWNSRSSLFLEFLDF